VCSVSVICNYYTSWPRRYRKESAAADGQGKTTVDDSAGRRGGMGQGGRGGRGKRDGGSFDHLLKCCLPDTGDHRPTHASLAACRRARCGYCDLIRLDRLA